MAGDNYKTTSPVLFIVFNRPAVTQRVFQAIRDAKPDRLYMAGDGPRADKEGEGELCRQARHVATQIDWPCQLFTRFQPSNLGCKDAVTSAISWFFENEAEGIILEDDCLPVADFFRFCDALLARYRDDTRVRHISGDNFQFGRKRSVNSYYFSRMTHIWGWATWRRVWADYDKDLSPYGLADIRHALSQVYSQTILVDEWMQVIEKVKNNEIDTWDYQLGIINFMQNGLCAMPNVNLVSNMGCGEGATHTHNGNNPNAMLPAGALGELTHPACFVPAHEADLFTLENSYGIAEKSRPLRRLKNKLKMLYAKGS